MTGLTLGQLTGEPVARPRFGGTVALVIGASTGIGAAVAIRLASEGARVVAADTGPDHRVVDIIARAGGSAICVVHDDLDDPNTCRLLIGDVLEIYGRLDILVHSATKPEEHHRITAPSRSLRDPADAVGQRIASAALPAITRSGGGSMLFAGPRATQPGFRTLIRTLATRYAAVGIRVNALQSIPADPPGPSNVSDERPRSERTVNADSAAATLLHLANPASRADTGRIVVAEDPATSRNRSSPVRNSTSGATPTATIVV